MISAGMVLTVYASTSAEYRTKTKKVRLDQNQASELIPQSKYN
jgi:hypothetical protein